MSKNRALILNALSVLLALVVLFSDQIPILEKDGKYWSMNDMSKLDIETNELSLEALEFAKTKGDIEAMEWIFKDMIEQYNSSINYNTHWGNSIASTAAKLLLWILSLQFFLIVRRK